MKCPALFLLAAFVLSGCVSDNQRPSEDGAEALHYRKLFEAGRRAESKGDVKIAGDTYGWLITRGSRYGEYGLAILLLRREPGCAEAVKHLIACAKRSSNTSKFFPDSAMDSAFSVAAMAKLADIAISEHDRSDVAASLRSLMSDVVTQNVRAWADEMKSDADSVSIYRDVISAVESSRPSREYVKAFKWPEISKILMNGDAVNAAHGDEKGRSAESRYSVVRFAKAPGATCQYDFEVRLVGNGTFEAAEKVQSAIRRQLLKEFLAGNPHDGVDDVRTSFLSWNQQGSTIKGSVAVMKVSAIRIEYDAATHCGKIAVRIDGKDVAAARKWVRENLAELAREKNIALTTGQLPSAAPYYSLGEKIDGNIMEIEFRTE